MIPPFDENGNLPEGIWDATLEEVRERFGCLNFRRRYQFERMQKAIELIKDIGGATLFLDGSFITCKSRPEDYDALVIQSEIGEKLSIILDKHPTVQKKIYGGEFYFAEDKAYDPYTQTQKTFLDYFQTDHRNAATYVRKGIIRIMIK